MSNFIWRLFDDHRAKYAIENSCCLAQYRYMHQATNTVTSIWNRCQTIKVGDTLIGALNGPRIIAVGKAIAPRLKSTSRDTIERTVNDRSHSTTNGIVFYDDADCFYENLNEDNGFGGGDDDGWGQRVDVEWEILANDLSGLRFQGIIDCLANDDGIHLDGIHLETIFEINDECTNRMRDMLGEQKKQTRASQKNLEEVYQFKQIILQGPPGTSKTYEAKKIAATILGLYPEAGTSLLHLEHSRFLSKKGAKTGGGWDIVQFHPSYNYEDFVRGIQVSTPAGAVLPSYKTINRILAEMAEAAALDLTEKYVLIVDEINRANLAAVLGELIYALEYRGESVNSLYSIDSSSGSSYELKIPQNLYIIGTMNTADRSIGHIDYAVRRRFAFIPMLPRLEDIETYHDLNNTGIKAIAKALFIAAGKLFVKDPETDRRDHAEILAPDFHADDVQPGHTYFMAKSCPELINKFVYQVYPLLREYYKDGILVPPNTTPNKEVSLPISVNGMTIDGITIEPIMSPQKLFEKLTLLCPLKQETPQNQDKSGDNKALEQSEDGDTKKESNADSEGEPATNKTNDVPPT